MIIDNDISCHGGHSRFIYIKQLLAGSAQQAKKVRQNRNILAKNCKISSCICHMNLKFYMGMQKNILYKTVFLIFCSFNQKRKKLISPVPD